MALVWKDKVAETSTTTGTGALTLSGALTGYRTFASVCSTDDTVYYSITAVDGNGNPTGDWETGLGTYSAANTLTRTTVLDSSNAGAAVNFSAGTKRVTLSQVAATISSGARPVLVQVKTLIANNSAVTMDAAPTAGNLLIAFATRWSNTASTNAGWTQLVEVNGSTYDGYMIAAKTVNPGETAAQTPFTTTGGSSTTIFEISGALPVIPISYGAVKEDTTSTMSVPVASPSNNALFVGVACGAGTPNDFTVSASGMTLTTHENVTGSTTSNSTRRSKSLSAPVAFQTDCTVVTSWTTGNYAGFGMVVSPR